MQDRFEPLDWLRAGATKLVLAMLGLALLHVTALASTISEADADLFRTIIQLPQSSTLSANDRRRIAAKAENYWRAFDALIPRNSPATDEWLRGEFASNDTNRMGTAAFTPEYARSQLSETSAQCVDIFRLLNDSIGADGTIEMYFWLRSLSCYENPKATVDYLQQAKLSNGRFDGPIPFSHANLLHRLITGSVARSLIREMKPVKAP